MFIKSSENSILLTKALNKHIFGKILFDLALKFTKTMFFKNFNHLTLQLSHITKIIFLATFLSLLLINKSYSAQPVFVIAKVNNQIITNIDLQQRYNLLLKISKIKINSKKDHSIIINQLLQKMIDETLQINEAKKFGIQTSQEEINQMVSMVSKDMSLNYNNIQNFFSRNKLSYETFTKQIRSQILWSQIVRNKIANTIKISDSDIDQLMESRKINTKINKFLLAEIFIPNEDNKENDSVTLSQKLYDDLKEDSDKFNVFVKQFSKSPTAEFDGEIGWVGEGDVDNKIYKAIQKLSVEEITKPISINNGNYLFKILEKKSFSSLDENDIEQAKDIIFSQKLKIMTRGYLMNLRKLAYIETNQNNINRFLKRN